MRGQYCRTSFTQSASFFSSSDFVTKYYIDTNKLKKCSVLTKGLQINRPSVAFYLWNETTINQLKFYGFSKFILDLVVQYFSKFESGLASHGKRQHLNVLVLGVKIAEYVFSPIFRCIIHFKKINKLLNISGKQICSLCKINTGAIVNIITKCLQF